MIDKSTLKILKYIYRHPYVTHQKLLQKFHCSEELLRKLSSAGYISIARTSAIVDAEGGHYFDILPDSTYCCLSPANIEVEKTQWFDGKFVLLQIVLPIVIAIITTLITIFLSFWLSPFR